MRRYLLIAIVAACGCKRSHDAPKYESDETHVAAVPTVNAPEDLAGAAAGASGSNPLGEPVLARRDTGARMPDGGTINGDPRGPRAAEFNKVLEAALARMPSCFAGLDIPPGEIAVKVHYVVEQPGYTSGVSVTATGAAPKAALDCAKRIIEETKFPSYQGSKVENVLPFNYTTRIKPVRVEASDAAVKP